ncbi:MAG: iron-containing alcohol dehydrogenase [Patescibacteria group bacterium]|nr:iron-containing alcohol dehydrogenase [Patescibacteria group bacterium]
MKLIYKNNGNKVFLGDSFKSDIDIILNKGKLQHKKVILVIGIKSFLKTQRYAQLKTVFKNNGIIIVKHLKVRPNPSELRIVRTLSKLRHKFDFVFALGGGSAIDAGKLIKHRFNDSAKLVVVYTLPGSATIVTPFTVFDNDEFKIGIAADNLIPDYSYISKQFIKSMSIERKIIAISDIFSHAIESLYSKAGNKTSKIKSKKSLKILTTNKVEQLQLDDFIKADIYAGLAERVALVLFPHAAGHYLTYKFNIPHSVATMHFLVQYLNLLANKGVNINLKYIQYAEYLHSLLKKRGLIRKINLSNTEIVELFNLTHKYMNFAYKNAPTKIKQNEYKTILKNYV